MRLARGLKSFLCCLVILSVGLMVAGPAWARDRGMLRDLMKERAIKGNTAAANTASALPKPKGAIAGLAAVAANKALALPKPKGAIANAIKAPRQPKLGSIANAIKAPRQPKLGSKAGALAGVIKAPRQPRLTGR